MGRIRSVKPEFCKSLSITELSRDTRLHFVMLWTYADDTGRGVNEPRLLKGELWPLDDDITAQDVSGFQNELEANGRLIQYEVDGRPYFEITNWKEHQHPQKPRPSTFPAPIPVEDCNSNDAVVLQEAYDTPTVHVPSVGEGRVVVGEGSKPFVRNPVEEPKPAPESFADLKVDDAEIHTPVKKKPKPEPDPDFEKWWGRYPKPQRIGKQRALKGWHKRRKDYEVEEINIATKTYVADCRKQDRTFKNAETFLHSDDDHVGEWLSKSREVDTEDERAERLTAAGGVQL